MPKMTFIERNGEPREVDAPIGLSVLEVAHKHGVDIEGACEGSLACSTCHVIVDPEWFGKLAKPSEDEEDMLDLAFGLEKTSRLGCQIVMSEALDGLVVRLPRRHPQRRRLIFMRVVVAMSGGVDSSVVAGLMARAGHEVIGVTLQLYDHGAAVGRKGACCAGQDIHDAKRVADRLGIAHYVIDAEARFRGSVIVGFCRQLCQRRDPGARASPATSI